MDVTGQSGSAGSLILQALADEHPAGALVRLHPTPRVARLLSQLFVVALRRCFAGHDAREVTAYVRDLLTWLELPAGGEPARQTEALIRAALGEPALAGGVIAARRYEIICMVVGDLARPPGAGPGVLAALVEQAERRVDRFIEPPARTPRPGGPAQITAAATPGRAHAAGGRSHR